MNASNNDHRGRRCRAGTRRNVRKRKRKTRGDERRERRTRRTEWADDGTMSAARRGRSPDSRRRRRRWRSWTRRTRARVRGSILSWQRTAAKERSFRSLPRKIFPRVSQSNVRSRSADVCGRTAAAANDLVSFARDLDQT